MSKGALGLLSAFWPEDTPRYAHIPLKTVNDATLFPIANAAPDRIAVVCGETSVTYGALADQIRALAGTIRNRAEKATRVAIGITDPIHLIVAIMAATDADVLAYIADGPPSPEALSAFSPALVIADSSDSAATIPTIGFDDLMAGEKKDRPGRPDFRTPLIAMPNADRTGEVVHNHKTLAAIGISLGKFYMLAEDVSIFMLEPPDSWWGLSMMLATFQTGATLHAGWRRTGASLPDRVDYVVSSWNRAMRLLDEGPGTSVPAKIAAGAVTAIEGPFSASRRQRVGRKLKTDILTILGRSYLGPVLASHPAWYLSDSAGIPLPNVDTRPMNPADGAPLNLGWEVVENAEVGVKSALTPAGGTLIDGWLRSGWIAQIDPTGFYFLLPEKKLRPV